MKTIGILGYGNLGNHLIHFDLLKTAWNSSLNKGKYLCEQIIKDTANFKLVYVWNRSPILNAENDSNLKGVDIISDLNDFAK